MFGIFENNQLNPIGLDIGEDAVRIIQLRDNGQEVLLCAGCSEHRPENIEPGSGNWQKWTIAAIHSMLENSKFQGKNAVAALPSDDTFIDCLKVSGCNNISGEKLSELIVPKIKQKLPFEPSKAVIKCIPCEDDNVIALATDRQKIDIHVAIYERIPLSVKSIAVWPLALVSCYVKFFGRRKTDVDSVVMLADVGPKNVNVVISRHKNLLFARSLPLGLDLLNGEEMTTRLAVELNACRRCFSSMYRSGQIDRLIFLTGNGVDRETFAKIAKQMELPAQMGDCLAATRIENPWNCKVERKGCKESWAAVCGLSLS